MQELLRVSLHKWYVTTKMRTQLSHRWTNLPCIYREIFNVTDQTGERREGGDSDQADVAGEAGDEGQTGTLAATESQL